MNKYTTTYKQTPHVSANRVITPTAICLHHSAGSFAGSESWILNTKSKVSYHYLINLDGNRTQFAQPTQRCWHAGKSSYKGVSDCNSFMVGVSFSGDTNKRQLTQEEVESVVELIAELKAAYPSIVDITTHKEVSPGRKNDISNNAMNQIKTSLENGL